MKSISVAALVAALSFATPASAAGATFQLGLSGTSTHFFNAFECPGLVCDPTFVETPWLGTVVVGLHFDADGTYTGSNLESLEVASNLVSFQTDGSGTGGFLPQFNLTATVVDGGVVSLDGVFHTDQFTTVTFSGLGVNLLFIGAHHIGPTIGNAVLVAIPEPSTLALVMVGLCTIVVMTRRSNGSRLWFRSRIPGATKARPIRWHRPT